MQKIKFINSKILHIILSISVLVSSAGIFLGKNHCQKEMEAMLRMALGEEVVLQKCADSPEGCQKGCCKTEFEYFQLDQEQQIQTFEFESLNKPVQLEALVSPKVAGLSSFYSNPIPFQTYKPPIVETDISVLFQVFLL